MLRPVTIDRMLLAAAALLGAAACNGDGLGAMPPTPDLTVPVDLAELQFAEPDLASDLGPSLPADPCGDTTTDNCCNDSPQGPPNRPFPLQSDADKNPLEDDRGVTRDASGFLVLQGSLDGRYSVFLQGCSDTSGNTMDTGWFEVQWDADVPPNTSLIVHAKSGSAASPADPSWMANPFTRATSTSPVNLQQALTPNISPSTGANPINDGYLYLEFMLKSTSPKASPRLKSFDVGFKCCYPE